MTENQNNPQPTRKQTREKRERRQWPPPIERHQHATIAALTHPKHRNTIILRSNMICIEHRNTPEHHLFGNPEQLPTNHNNQQQPSDHTHHNPHSGTNQQPPPRTTTHGTRNGTTSRTFTGTRQQYINI
jgi:hypothetical protein